MRFARKEAKVKALRKKTQVEELWGSGQWHGETFGDDWNGGNEDT